VLMMSSWTLGSNVCRHQAESSMQCSPSVMHAFSAASVLRIAGNDLLFYMWVDTGVYIRAFYQQ